MRSLNKDVSEHEMWQLRKDGWSNWEISQKLGCSEATIRRYLGRQPKECRGSRMGHVVPKKKEVVEIPKQEMRIDFPVTGIELKGKCCAIRLDLVKPKAVIINKNGEIALDGRYISDLISDLAMAKKALEKYGGAKNGVSGISETETDTGKAIGI